MLNTFTLSNGIKVATYNLPQLRSVYILSSVLGGSTEEDPAKNGVAHFMEHMLCQGIPSFKTVEEMSVFIESLSGNYNASTGGYGVNFYITLPKNHLEDGLKISSEVLFEPLFPEDALERERGAVLDEISQRMDSHYFKINKFYKESRYKKTSRLLLNEGGSEETVKKITRDDLINYWQKYFLPQNTYLIIVGNFDALTLLPTLEKYYSKYQSIDKFNGFSDSSKDFRPGGVFLRNDPTLRMNYFDLTFPSISLEASVEDRTIQNLLMVIFGGLRNSRLFKILRYQLGLVYSVHSGYSINPKHGYGYITAQSLPEKTDQVLEIIFAEFRKYLAMGPTKEEFNFAKNYLSNQFLMAFDHPSAIASWIEGGLLWSGKVRLPEEHIHIMNQIKFSDLKKFMAKNWQLSDLNLVIQGQVKEEEKKKFQQLIKTL